MLIIYYYSFKNNNCELRIFMKFKYRHTHFNRRVSQKSSQKRTINQFQNFSPVKFEWIRAELEEYFSSSKKYLKVYIDPHEIKWKSSKDCSKTHFKNNEQCVLLQNKFNFFTLKLIYQEKIITIKNSGKFHKKTECLCKKPDNHDR